MKRIYLVLLEGIIAFSSCAAPSTQTKQINEENATSTKVEESSAIEDILGGLVNALTGNTAQQSASSYIGTWNYAGVSCILQSDDVFSQLGGAYATKQLEGKMNEYLAKVGIKAGACSFVLGEDKSCAFRFGSHQITGTYSINTSSKKISFQFLYGQLNITADYTMSGNSMSIVFDANGMLTLVKKAISLTENSPAVTTASSTVGVIATLLEPFDGLKLGMKLTK